MYHCHRKYVYWQLIELLNIMEAIFFKIKFSDLKDTDFKKSGNTLWQVNFKFPETKVDEQGWAVREVAWILWFSLNARIWMMIWLSLKRRKNMTSNGKTVGKYFNCGFIKRKNLIKTDLHCNIFFCSQTRCILHNMLFH